ncbi:MAG: flagellar export chaperone FlgN [Oligoflexia bacterium]|nr:flagellar export chaperone FlgN [Oligoflexia bacterium]
MDGAIELIREVYGELSELWKGFCEKHMDLFSITCDEYALLLSNDIDDLEVLLKRKDEIINEIKILELRRRDIIEFINNSKLFETKISSAGELLLQLQKYEEKMQERHLFRYNALLLDVIDKIRTQNKKTQMYLNKSLISIREIREGIMGKKECKIYNANGMTSAATNKR